LRGSLFLNYQFNAHFKGFEERLLINFNFSRIIVKQNKVFLGFAEKAKAPLVGS